MMEAIFAVTPSETIKTKLIDDAKRAQPRYPPGLVSGSLAIIRDEGIGGVYRGLVPVMLRQGANSSVRFGTYSTLRNFVQGSGRPGQPLPGGITFGIGAVAGIVTVYATMPLDVVKTRMQSLEGSQYYRNTLRCMALVLREEGLFAFWRGATPRLARLVLSGGIVFTVVRRKAAPLYDTHRLRSTSNAWVCWIPTWGRPSCSAARTALDQAHRPPCKERGYNRKSTTARCTTHPE